MVGDLASKVSNRCNAEPVDLYAATRMTSMVATSSRIESVARTRACALIRIYSWFLRLGYSFRQPSLCVPGHHDPPPPPPPPPPEKPPEKPLDPLPPEEAEWVA